MDYRLKGRPKITFRVSGLFEGPIHHPEINCNIFDTTPIILFSLPDVLKPFNPIIYNGTDI